MGLKKGVDLNSVSQEKATEGKETWRTVRPGVNYSGFCGNASCPAFKQNVVQNMGTGSRLVTDDVMQQAIRCPQCGTPFELNSICLYQCAARVVIHDHTTTTDEYRVERDDVIRLGARGEKEGKERRNSAECLVEIATKPLHKDCIIC
eukprot:TRINITY_DN2042_c0_g1_i1.p1 TRINITY_DN2042_c0_g1~~TRINITY_DN2042_c0_g1_i1.p1  ORF type:complete len:148 (-),score=25.19 TRINITY_DN2042_c0_g1_i1:91-534(-)